MCYMYIATFNSISMYITIPLATFTTCSYISNYYLATYYSHNSCSHTVKYVTVHGYEC